MTKAKILMLGAAIAMVSVFATPAAAQDGPSITVEPSSVDAAGEAEFTVTGEGWTAAPPVFVLPCEAPASGDIADVDSATCDTANLTPATPADGSFEVTVTYDVPEGGLAIAAGDAAQSESASALITVGAAAEGEGEAAAEGEGEEMAEGDAEAEAVAETDEMAEGEELAETGIESGLLAIIGIAVLAAGAMVLTSTRRVGRV